ncbi:MAG: hypothetical protein V2A67_04535 [Bacteroidota bacterium]
MKTFTRLFLLAISLAVIPACNLTGPDNPEPDPSELAPIGTLDMAFVYRVQGIPALRMKKVDLCLALTADDLYRGIFFTCANVSEAITHYQFRLPPGVYYYYASIICLCEGDSCKYSGFPGQNGLQVAGGKVEVFDDEITRYTTQFH